MYYNIYLTPHLPHTYFQQEDFSEADRWFTEYLGTGSKTFRKEALLRKGDCLSAVFKIISKNNSVIKAVDRIDENINNLPLITFAVGVSILKAFDITHNVFFGQFGLF